MEVVNRCTRSNKLELAYFPVNFAVNRVLFLKKSLFDTHKAVWHLGALLNCTWALVMRASAAVSLFQLRFIL